MRLIRKHKSPEVLIAYVMSINVEVDGCMPLYFVYSFTPVRCAMRWMGFFFGLWVLLGKKGGERGGMGCFRTWMHDHCKVLLKHAAQLMK